MVDIVATGSYNGDMKAVGIRELKNKLSQYLREVSRGEQILVTDRGIVVAELGPPSLLDAETLRQHHPGLVRLALQGRVRLGLPGAKGACSRLNPIHLPEGTARELLDWTRGEG